MIEKIYLDMDGVLADFDSGVRNICGMFTPKQDRSEKDDEEMWAKIRKVGHFYDKLEPMPGALEMFDKIYGMYGDKCEILTGIPKPKRGIITAGEDKIAWVQRLLSEDIKINIVFREDKPQYCSGKGAILIDDYPVNIEEWEKQGGTGILHTSPAETMKALSRYAV